MDEFSIRLNETLVDAFKSILKIEEQTLKKSANIDLSINEMHLIESIGKGKEKEKGKTISSIAEDLGITLPSVTVAINKLLKKGYVEKKKCDIDARVNYVTLTKQGLKIEKMHRYFHERLVSYIVKKLTDEEKNAMLKGIIKLTQFFEKKVEAMNE